jgi:uncharacterized membrane protein
MRSSTDGRSWDTRSDRISHAWSCPEQASLAARALVARMCTAAARLATATEHLEAQARRQDRIRRSVMTHAMLRCVAEVMTVMLHMLHAMHCATHTMKAERCTR